jgi:ABC-type Fe3+-hydroxamate transport system substrate-binding protein
VWTELTDQTGRVLKVKLNPQKVVSLVPSVTETLIAIGLSGSIAARTKFCIHPKDTVSGIPKVGGTKTPKIHHVMDIKPDLIIANKEENRQEDISVLNDFPIYVSDIKNTSDVIHFLNDMQEIFPDSSAKVSGQKIYKAMETLPENPVLSACYLIWRDPWMTIGNDTFIHYMLLKAGFNNVFSESNRYPVIRSEDIISKSPDVVMLSSEPYPFKEKHIDEISQLLPDAKIILADGELFSWYGTRMLKFPEYVRKLQTQLGNY